MRTEIIESQANLMIDNIRLARTPILRFVVRKWFNPIRYMKGKYKSLPSIWQ